MHRPHGDVHDEGLFDDCEGCAELAGNPFANADDEMMLRWIEKVTPRDRALDGSGNELLARRNVLNALEHAGRLISVHPAACTVYLERWRVDASFSPAQRRSASG